MAVEDHPLFKKWDAAFQRYKRLSDFYNELSNKRRGDDQFLQQAMQERDQAQREYQRISERL